MFNLFISDYKMLQTATGTECNSVPLNTGEVLYVNTLSRCYYIQYILYSVTCMYIQRRETH